MSTTHGTRSYASIVASSVKAEGQNQETITYETSLITPRSCVNAVPIVPQESLTLLHITTDSHQTSYISPGMRLLDSPRASSTQPDSRKRIDDDRKLIRDDSYTPRLSNRYTADMPDRMRLVVSEYSTQFSQSHLPKRDDSVEEYLRIFFAITNCTLAATATKNPQDLLPVDFNPSTLTESEIDLLRMRFHCAIFEGVEDRFCDCCSHRPRNQAELRFDAIEVAIVVYQEYIEANTSQRPTYADALMHCRDLLTENEIYLADIEAELIKAGRLPMFRAENLFKTVANAESTDHDFDNLDCDSGLGSEEYSEHSVDVMSDPVEHDLTPLETPMNSLHEDSDLVRMLSQSKNDNILERPLDYDENTFPAQEMFQNSFIPPKDAANFRDDSINADERTPMSLVGPQPGQSSVQSSPLDNRPRQEQNLAGVQESHGYGMPSIYRHLDVETSSAERKSVEDLQIELVEDVGAVENPKEDKCQQNNDDVLIARKKMRRKKSHRKQKTGSDCSVQSQQSLADETPEESQEKPGPLRFYRFSQKCADRHWYAKISDIDEHEFQTTPDVVNRINVYYRADRTLQQTYDQIGYLENDEPNWARDFEIRCLRLYCWQLETEQSTKSQKTFSIPELGEKRMNGVTRERVELAIGKISPRDFVQVAMKIDHSVPVAEHLKTLRTAILALFDHTMMQFEPRLHVVPEERIELLDKLKKKYNGLGGKLDLKDYRKAGEGFREVFMHLDAQNRSQLMQNRAATLGHLQQLREMYGDSIQGLENIQAQYFQTDNGVPFDVINLESLEPEHQQRVQASIEAQQDFQDMHEYHFKNDYLTDEDVV